MSTATDSVLIIGGSGLVGGALARAFVEQGRQVVVVDLRQSALSGVTYVQANALQPGVLQDLIAQHAPSVVLNAVNVATIFSGQENGYKGLIGFYAELYGALSNAAKPVHYLQIGTTGSGGLGFDIPFTHGGAVEDMPIIHKAAFAGIGSQLLLMIQRSFNSDQVRVSEVKPGLAIFNPSISVDNFEQYSAVTLDGGESGAYTYDELSLLTHYMGYTTVDRVASVVQDVLNQKFDNVDLVKHDLTHVLGIAVVSQDDHDAVLKQQALDQLRQTMQGKICLPATGNLGPPSVTRDLILAAALLKGEWLDGELVRGAIGYMHRSKPELAAWLGELDLSSRMEELRSYMDGSSEAWQIVARVLDAQRG